MRFGRRSTRPATGPDVAARLLELGLEYFDLPSDKARNLARGIDCFTEALEFYTAEAAPTEYAQTQFYLGTAYIALPDGDRTAHLNQAIGCFTEALRCCPFEASPPHHALIQSNLGVAYGELGPATMSLAIGCFHEALRFFTAEIAPEEYAQIQYGLGTAYSGLPGRDRAAHLARAIECYQEALRCCTPESDAAHYRRIQHNLGVAHFQLPTGDRAASLSRAIDCYIEVLRYCSPQDDPDEYAMTLSMLGAAYSELPTGDREANLARAIDCFSRALRFRSAAETPAEYVKTQNNLSAAYCRLRTGDQEGNVGRAIGCLTQALECCDPRANPADYVLTLSNLGRAYTELPAADLARAIECYTEALRYCTPDASPVEYSFLKHNLGFAYASLPAADLGRAIECYTEALRIRTPEATPGDCRDTARYLGEAHFSQRRWASAHDAFSLAIEATELLYQATGSGAGRRATLGDSWDVVAADAYCLARLGRLADAIQRLEAGRARALADALARDQSTLREATEADREAFAAAADRIKSLEAEDRRAAEDQRSFAERSAELVRARAALAEVIERIRRYRPGFAGQGLDYREIAATVAPARPLVYLLSTSLGSLALLVPAGSRSPAPEHAVWLDGLPAARLNKLFLRKNPPGGYLVGQLADDLDMIAESLPEIIEVLRRDLLGPVAERLAKLGAAQATVVPVGLLSLLPVAAAAPPGCTIALVPSARALREASRALGERTGSPTLLAVGNPLPLPDGWSALEYAAVEVRAIERFFGARRVRYGKSATMAAVTRDLPGATHLHLACHGGFDVDEPLESALYLAGGERLTLRDLLDGGLDLSGCRLAVLSACQTGVTEFERVPDEVIGLPAAFLQAGVPGVVATLWPVNDRSTAVLVAEFYRLLFAGRLDPASALAGARDHLRDATARDLADWFERRYADSGYTDQAARDAAASFRSHPDPAARPYAAPVYWAGFVYVGP